MDHSRVKDRARLKALPKGEPHWQRIRPGCFVGFAPSTKEGEGTWHARAYDPDKRGYRRKALGAFSDAPGHAKFILAKAEAERFADLVETGGHRATKLETVADACSAYAESRPEAEQRFKRYVYNDPIAKVKLDRLRRHHLQEWRMRLKARPSLVSRRKQGEKRVRTRAASTINRDMAVLRAALAKVLAIGTPNSEAAWQEALKPIRNANGRRTLYLDKRQRKALLEKVSEEAAPFVEALCLLPLRPGALAALTVGDFEGRTKELAVGNDKNGKPRRIKLPDVAAELLVKQTRNRHPSAPLFIRSNGNPWNKDSWKVPIAAAVAAAELDLSVTAYTLRHSIITDLVHAGLPLLTIAQISGTSAEMIERHYGHLASDAALGALAKLAF